MIKTTGLIKRFGDFTAIDNISCEIPKGCIYGMVGSNGAGKSTFLRLLTGIYKQNNGEILIDGEPVFENPKAKEKTAFVPDELYFLPGADTRRMAQLYNDVCKNFDNDKYYSLLKAFNLPDKKPITTFSKGMKRQTATALALASNPEYLFFDETFDGLDPVMRAFVKGLIMKDVADRGVTAIITSHSLRELEDTCDQLVLLHKGGVILESDINDLKSGAFKVQTAFGFDYTKELFGGLDITAFNKNGSVTNMIVHGDIDAIKQSINAHNPLLLEILPMSLEEVFTCEMQQLGYDFTEILEGIGSEKQTV